MIVRSTPRIETMRQWKLAASGGVVRMRVVLLARAHLNLEAHAQIQINRPT